MMRTGLSIGAAAVPVATLAASLTINVDVGQWLQMPAPLVRSLAGEALLYSTCVAVCAAPLVGVAVTTAEARTPRRLLISLVQIAMLFTGMSALLFLAAAGSSMDTMRQAAASHATLASAAIMLAAMGALCAMLFRDPLDAAATALAAALVLALGVLVGGAPVGDAPHALVDAALTASPIVGVASAAGIDIFHQDVLYQISPLSHVGFEYPEWYAASACYVIISALCATAVMWKRRKSNTPVFC